MVLADYILLPFAYLIQLLAAAALGVPANKVLTRVKRLGMIAMMWRNLF